MPSHLHAGRGPGQTQAGASLIVVMVLLMVVTGLGIAAVQLSIMGERGARNDRDYQLAWQSAEAGLMESEFDIRGPNASGSNRLASFSTDNIINFVPNCGSSGPQKGLCTPNLAGKPAWLNVEFIGNSAADFGDFTGRSFASASGAISGLKPAYEPRYVIEVLNDTASGNDASYGATRKYVYRVTSMGFGPRTDIQAVVQMLFRKE
ncbi:PilX N-terminal domain-containing pilus assembly protein [Acidovorax sp. NCPPB 2350]|nr:PilX N-terminal domain-containing pilus assembly protein [Acidovorax sp. NCPPB 2350]WCM92973.1 PilX N-terminal domain-containing pilus assembly protein [Acidovorax sp. NCPPB 2350]